MKAGRSVLADTRLPLGSHGSGFESSPGGPLRNEDAEGVTHCALGSGDGTCTEPENPPAPTADQTLLKSEFIRKTTWESSFLVEDLSGTITVGGVTYAETGNHDGEMLVPGYLHEVRNTPDFNKGANTMLERVAVVTP